MYKINERGPNTDPWGINNKHIFLSRPIYGLKQIRGFNLCTTIF